MSRYVCQRVALVMACCMLATTAGCACPQVAKDHPTATGATVGGLTGGAVGAIVGRLIGGNTKGAVIGGLTGAALGALAGAVIGSYTAEIIKDPEETMREEGHSQSQGNLVRLKAIEVEPSETGPGDVVKIGFIYAVVTSNTKAAVPVTESRMIEHNGEEVLTSTFVKEQPNGTIKSSVPLALSSQAEPGTYTVRGAITVAGEKVTKLATFTVK